MFQIAIKELLESGDSVGKPQAFQEYIKKEGIVSNTIRTAHYLSIYSLKGLNKELRHANCTIFRLGSPPGERYTHFALAKVNRSWSDFFLIDNELFINKPKVFDLSHLQNIEFLYHLLPSLSEVYTIF